MVADVAAPYPPVEMVHMLPIAKLTSRGLWQNLAAPESAAAFLDESTCDAEVLVTREALVGVWFIISAVDRDCRIRPMVPAPACLLPDDLLAARCLAPLSPTLTLGVKNGRSAPLLHAAVARP